MNNCPDEVCTCGEQGRTELSGTVGFGSEEHFGVHTVRAAGVNGSRADASGFLTVAEASGAARWLWRNREKEQGKRGDRVCVRARASFTP